MFSRFILCVSLAAGLATGSLAADTTRIACIGNSITAGGGINNTETEKDTAAYPGRLNKALRTAYMTQWIPTLTDTVYNWGFSGATLQKHGDVPYWTCAEFPSVFTCRPAIVTICLGTNDTKPWNWAASINSPTQFPIDYQSMIDTFSHIATHPKIFVCLPTACSDSNMYTIHDSVLSKYIIPSIRAVAAANHLPIIDVHTPFIKHVNYTGNQVQSSTFWLWGDGVHPLDTGHIEIADIFYEAIVNSYDIVTPVGPNGPFKIQFLWYGYAPRATGNDTLSKPMLSWYPAPDSNNTGVSALVVPGGGYVYISDGEGSPVAKWLNQKGISAFVLRYRYSNNTNTAYYYPTPMLDIARAMRLIRYRASAFKIDSTKIGVIGFSAGGHLASWLETHYDGGNAASPDSIEKKKDRPDWAFLLYPMTTMLNYAYAPGRTALLGNNPTVAVEDTLTNALWVTSQTPPTFLDYGTTDNLVNPENSIIFNDSLISKKVKQKLMTEPGKGHGFGLAATWPDTALTWLKGLGILTPPAGIAYQKSCLLAAAPDFSVTVSRAGLLIKSSAASTATFSIFSLSGNRYAGFTLAGGGSRLWRPSAHGAFIVRLSSGGVVRMRTILAE